MNARLYIAALASAASLIAGQWTAASPLPVSQADTASSVVVYVRIEDQAITPVTELFVDRAIDEAEDVRAACFVIILDTPGGLMESTRRIVKRIIASEVPVVVYVAPSGARAASAGLFITLTAHVAAMAPGTHIGAAHPVQLGGFPAGPAPADTARAQETSTMEDKVLNDAVAWVRSLAKLRGRNADWAELAVTESRAITEIEAVENNVADFIAADLSEVLEMIDGRKVSLAAGEHIIATSGATLREEQMWWGEKLLGIVSNPNIAFLLIIFGFYGILFELYSPGWGVGGTVGIVCLLTGFFALAVLPVNYTGLALIILALAMFVAEVFVTSFGALTLGGVICLILGAVMLIDTPLDFLRVSLVVVVPVALATAAITFFLVGKVVQAHRKRVMTGTESMVGLSATADEDFEAAGDEFTGFARIHGELWKAHCGTPVKGGQSLVVRNVKGLLLIVELTPRGPG